MRSNNPVFSRTFGRNTNQQYATFNQPQYGIHTDTVSSRLTVDDVVVKTLALVSVTVAVAAVSWFFFDQLPFIVFPAAAVAGLVLGLVISFKRITNPAAIMTYALCEGLFLGGFSRIIDSATDNTKAQGIVIPAVAGTLALFLAMAALYKFRVIRATARFNRWLLGALIGAVILMLTNLVLGLFGVNDGNGLGLRSGGTLAIIFSLICIGIASFTFISDFGAVEDAVQAGADQRYAWYFAFGILVGLVWLYTEILRLLSYLRR